ncbi:2-hydroxyhepta-2,4-diene-1,7-dioate isomerase [Methanocella sp. CWC-04]|uniref:2-hydroxyhepta-2,4-diene-1,7-dioate isomerase n=1 Tax=Methanooceanicella nereidis TaxID=2052831 RepID=A0AAP2RBH8_9EURY|nr:fumarylacetoacetate hydrolase family protein [Methanocella sp. CWC-04]MCD1293841.1 2-hydroxyhepta-2,4-diene-1,7-dioate isomerase [Methanocella sp. CWC-04]
MTVIGRFMDNGMIFEGEVVGDKVISRADFREYGLNELKILPPCSPSKVVCVGLNYRDHAEEMKDRIPDEPVLFLKPPSSVIGHGDNIIYPAQSKRIDYEAELAVVIGKKTGHIRADKADDHILGYTCLNDVTARDLQKKDVQWTRAKSFDTFSPIGPFIVTGVDPSSLSIKSRLNGEVKQSSNTKNLIVDVRRLVEFVSGVMTLEAGDVIATGTPSGIGPMEKGDVIEIEIEKVGTLMNLVA